MFFQCVLYGFHSLGVEWFLPGTSQITLTVVLPVKGRASLKFPISVKFMSINDYGIHETWD